MPKYFKILLGLVQLSKYCPTNTNCRVLRPLYRTTSAEDRDRLPTLPYKNLKFIWLSVGIDFISTTSGETEKVKWLGGIEAPAQRIRSRGFVSHRSTWISLSNLNSKLFFEQVSVLYINVKSNSTTSFNFNLISFLKFTSSLNVIVYYY